MEVSATFSGTQNFKPRALETILLGGLTVAVLDITNAMTFWFFYRNVPPVRILQSVASGLLGKQAFAGGTNTAMLGAGLHVFIACTVAAVFYVGCRVWPALLRRPVASGTIYGLGVFAVMNFVVLPLSAARQGAFHLPWLLDEVTGHAVLIGLPVALIARWSANRQASTT